MYEAGFEAYLWSVRGLIYRRAFSVLKFTRHPSFHLRFHTCTPVKGQMWPGRGPKLVSTIVESRKESLLRPPKLEDITCSPLGPIRPPRANLLPFLQKQKEVTKQSVNLCAVHRRQLTQTPSSRLDAAHQTR